MLVIVARCSRKWSEDFMTSSNEFYVFHMSTHLQSSVFCSENSLWSNILNLMQTKVTPWIPIFSFFQYDPKEVRVLTNLFFFCFGLADDRKSFNATCNNYVFFYYFEIFFLLIILQQELPPVIDHLGLECTSNKMLCSSAHVWIKS